jgi:hypothetical protein
MMLALQSLNFVDTVRALTDEYTPPGVPYIERAPDGKSWVLTAPGAQYLIDDSVFRELHKEHCIAPKEAHFVASEYAYEYVKTL